MERDTIELTLDAATFAAERHRAQRRKGGDTPYINHPLAVARILAVEARVADPNTLAAALLHDTLEDTATTRNELEQRFGPEIAAIVAEVTDDRSLPKLDRKHAQIEHAAHLSPAARLVKLADKLANLRDLAAAPPPAWDGARIQGYFCWAFEVVRAIGEEHAVLGAALERQFQCELVVDGVPVRAVPTQDRERADCLARYYESLRGRED